MKRLMLLSAFLLNSCGTSSPTAKVKDAPMPRQQVTVDGADAAKLFMALQAGGVEARLLPGGNHVPALFSMEIDHIACQAPVVPNAVVHCTIAVAAQAKILNPIASTARSILDLLKAHGAKVYPAALGAELVEAKSLVCMHEDAPHAQYSCSFFVTTPGPNQAP